MNKEFSKKFTDIEYLSKYEVAQKMQNNLIEPVWNNICDYRKLYRQELSLKMIERLNFHIVLTPSILNKISIIEKKLLYFFKNFYKRENYHEIFKENIFTEIKYLYKYLKEEEINESLLKDFILSDDVSLLAEDLLKLKSFYKIILNYNDLENLNINNDFINKVCKELEIDSSFKESNNEDSENNKFYRKKQIEDSTSRLIIGRIFTGANPLRINSHLDLLYEFINQNYEFSNLSKAVIAFVYFKYIIPLENNNDEIAIIILYKMLSDTVLNETAYILPFISYLYKNKEILNISIENSKKTGDLTYAFLACLDIISSSLESFNDFFENIKEDNSELEIKEEELNKKIEIESINNLSNNCDFTNKFINENIYDTFFNKNIEVGCDNDLQFYKNEKAENVFNLKSVNLLENYLIDEDRSENQFNDLNELNKIKVNYNNKENQFLNNKILKEIILSNELIELDKISLEDLKQHLLELHPTLKRTQAQFLVNHRQFGKYYTINQFKKYNNCAYETARTSMENLVKIGYYKKEQIGNKFIYTPIK